MQYTTHKTTTLSTTRPTNHFPKKETYLRKKLLRDHSNCFEKRSHETLLVQRSFGYFDVFFQTWSISSAALATFYSGNFILWYCSHIFFLLFSLRIQLKRELYPITHEKARQGKKSLQGQYSGVGKRGVPEEGISYTIEKRDNEKLAKMTKYLYNNLLDSEISVLIYLSFV
jgi:hypothetical protein